MADDMKRRREIAARAFVARRGELGLTQEQVAARGDVAVKTIQSFESRAQPRWPNARTRARLEQAVGWAPGHIEEIADQQDQHRKLDAHTKRVIRSALPDDEDYRRVIGVLEGRLIVIEPGEEGPESGQAAL